jgi:nucleoside-diphosphate-sugar epimerase
VRPTVVFGERNRGNVYNLIKQIASGRFVMIGNGLNKKSMAYVENIAAFLNYSLGFDPGIHVYNYIDKPDFTMNQLVSHVNGLLGKSKKIKVRLPYQFGLLIGKIFDVASKLSDKKFSISSIRVKKFCSNSIFSSRISSTGFSPPVPLIEALERTIRYEFIENHQHESVFYSE